MKKFRKIVCAALASLVCCVGIAGCANKGESTLLRGAEKGEKLSYQEETEDLPQISAGAEKFASAFAGAAFSQLVGQNFAVSPVSVYMALSLAAQSAAHQTREEILSALNVSYEELSSGAGYLYRSLNRDFISGKVRLSNSVWVDEGTQVRQECLDTLAEQFFCSSFSADFAHDNQAANDAVRYFVKEQTNGLIDKDFQLTSDTYFALINALYLKDSWNTDGRDLSLTADDRTFTGEDGEIISKKFLQGDYKPGRVWEGETFSTFYTSTNAGFSIKFLVPKEGYTLSEVFTEENLAAVSGCRDYNAIDEENKIRYETRCIFPEFHASFDRDVAGILRSFGIVKLFDGAACDLTSLMERESMERGNAYCYKIQHVTDLTVDRKGIEGAAVTVAADGAESAEMYETVREEFVVDRPFGFILTDTYGTSLFSGAVYSI